MRTPASIAFPSCRGPGSARQWQTAGGGETAPVGDRLSLQLGPLAPFEIETGTTGEGDRRSWFAQLRFSIELGGG